MLDQFFGVIHCALRRTPRFLAVLQAVTIELLKRGAFDAILLFAPSQLTNAIAVSGPEQEVQGKNLGKASG